MSWRDSIGRVTFPDGRVLIGASFRGVPFYVEAAERGGGRRTVRHEFPLRDQPFVEDMGRAARSFPVEGYVLGEGYVAQRDALISALEEAGPGELVHPAYGSRRVICSSFRVRESTAEGGIARFGLEFEETEATAPAPVATVAAAAQVDAFAVAVLAAARVRSQAARASDLPSSALASVTAVIQDGAEAMRSALAPLTVGAQSLAALHVALGSIASEAASLARVPGDALDAFSAAVSGFGQPDAPARGTVRALLAASAFTPSSDRPTGTTATRLLEAAAYDLALEAARIPLVVEAARTATVEAFDTYDAAVSVRDAICDELDTLAAGADDATFAALEQLRAHLVLAVPGEDSDLPRLVTNVPAYTVPSLVLAHRIYGDVALEADLVTRNGVERPGFVPGEASLEVLSHG